MIIVRADAGPEIGVGHIMRCLSVADVLKKQEEIVFFSANEYARRIVNDRGFECFVLGTDYRNMQEEVGVLKETDYYKKSCSIVVDSYYVTDDYFKEIRENKKLVYFDDYMEQAYSTDAIINYNIFADIEKYKEIYRNISKATKFILGPMYAPLRKEFSGRKQITVEDKVSNVLILAGGADPCHVEKGLTDVIKEECSGKERTGIQYHFVVGALSEDYDYLREAECAFPSVIKLYRDVKDMRSLMQQSDMAVSAAGSTLYELCACGVPTITYVSADNQKKAENAFVYQKLMLSAGDAREGNNFFLRLSKCIKELASDVSLRRVLADRGAQIVDGKGATRISNEIIKVLRNVSY